MKDRQKAMSSTLLAIRLIARRSLRSGAPPDFEQLRRLIAYVERFPQKTHQPAEERYLLSAVATRAPEAARAVARAKRDHAACMGYLNRLRSALERWEIGDPKAPRESAIVADDYVRFCRLHARIEARDVLSVAAKVLTARDWRTIGDGFAATDDPVARSRRRADCAAALRALTP